ncbi:XkdX family protein [Liquorilactobacillus satsumensis]|uniref:XkdX family protein n=1 Tax=Liquorilactobacillus satsumensis TaxID=259059 RepID=UPI0021C31EA6|nr:XkdX family protein [Liquorilactobacillus satsumensis]MCP9357363.1 XkdX family protein [Liquorilactobacillus satsumensis]MCP9372077.1 XkdX family protein [Liquorilactobacillus satsumensis]
MNWFPLIKEYYLMGLYTDTQLDIFVNASWITADQRSEMIEAKSETSTSSQTSSQA